MKPSKLRTRGDYPIIAMLRQTRRSRRIPRKMIAHITGYAPYTIGRWERGQTVPSFQALHDWAQALNLRITAKSMF